MASIQFDVPRDGPTRGPVLDHRFTPGYFVIGESAGVPQATTPLLDWPSDRHDS